MMANKRKSSTSFSSSSFFLPSSSSYRHTLRSREIYLSVSLHHPLRLAIKINIGALSGEAKDIRRIYMGKKNGVLSGIPTSRPPSLLRFHPLHKRRNGLLVGGKSESTLFLFPLKIYQYKNNVWKRRGPAVVNESVVSAPASLFFLPGGTACKC